MPIFLHKIIKKSFFEHDTVKISTTLQKDESTIQLVHLFYPLTYEYGKISPVRDCQSTYHKRQNSFAEGGTPRNLG